MDIKLFDSELKVMDVLWKQGDTPAREIARALGEELGWNVNTTYTLIKRCIATAGQTIDIDGDGFLYIDGVAQTETYTHGKPTLPLTNSTITFPYTVPSGYIWVMGDNRTNSQDSRYFGAVPTSSVTGRGVLVYWPVPDFGLLEEGRVARQFSSRQARTSGTRQGEPCQPKPSPRTRQRDVPAPSRPRSRTSS